MRALRGKLPQQLAGQPGSGSGRARCYAHAVDPRSIATGEILDLPTRRRLVEREARVVPADVFRVDGRAHLGRTADDGSSAHRDDAALVVAGERHQLQLAGWAPARERTHIAWRGRARIAADHEKG